MDIQNRRELHCIKRIASTGDRDAANELIKEYYPITYGFIIKQMKDIHIAMDITQETFIAMLKNIALFDHRKASLKTWLLKIANNKIIDYYRSKYFKTQMLNEDIAAIDFENVFITDNDEWQEELVDKALSALEKLPPESQQVIRLKIFAEFTFAEISSVTGLSENTLKSKYYSALKKLRLLMEVQEGEKR